MRAELLKSLEDAAALPARIDELQTWITFIEARKRFKHYSFDSECEWRLVYHGNEGTNQRANPSFRMKDGERVPYVILPLLDFYNNDTFPLASVWVGPRGDAALVDEVKTVLARHGHDPGIVRRSKVPLR